MEKTPTGRKIIRISRTKLILGIIILIVVALVIFSGINRLRMGTYGVSSNMMSSSDVPSVSFGGSGSGGGGDYYPMPYHNQEADITDTREFLKTSYSGNIKTRDVSEIIKDVKNEIRDVEGRVDNFSSSEKSGYVSFVVPKSNFDEFRDNIESLTHKKLYTENISSQNLLTQKQGIEANAETINNSISSIQAAILKAKQDHASRLAVLQQQLVMEQETFSPGTTSSDWQAILISRIQAENDFYTRQVASNNAKLATAQENLKNNVKQDVAFENNIETVNGSVNVNWISLWQMAKIFSPVHPTIIVILLALGLLYFLNRKQYLPKVEVV